MREDKTRKYVTLNVTAFTGSVRGVKGAIQSEPNTLSVGLSVLFEIA